MNSEDTNDTRSYSMRRRARKVRELEDKIMHATFEQFSRALYNDVTVAAVANAAGCSEQTIYRKYGSKEGLLRALGEREAVDMSASRDSVAAGDVEMAVERVVTDYEDAGDVMLLIQAQAPHVEVIREMFERGRDHHHQWVRRVFGTWLDAVDDDEHAMFHAELVVALDVQTWKRLRRDLGFSRDETTRTMRDLTMGILSRAESRGDR